MNKKRILTVAMSCSISTMAFSYQVDGTTNKNVLENKYNTPQFMLNHVYLGIFGGGGSFSTNSLNQKGTALFSSSKGGPLAVNAFGVGSNNSIGVGGVHVGYKWLDLLKEKKQSKWSLVPATELEGYYLGGTQGGDDLNNATDRLDEHDFKTTYPMHTGVFLANAVLTIDHSDRNKIHPYVGAGLGAAIISISGATSTQKSPPEPGINHYNSNPDASDWTFATQAKIGLRFDLTPSSSVFAEYRFLYLSPTEYTFGSTQYPAHAATTNWNVHVGGLYNNIGTVGIQFDL